MTERDNLEKAFLEEAGWLAAHRAAITGDASTRSYHRLTLDGRKAILMNAPPAAESASCPPDATPSQRALLGYNAQARLAGANLHAFTTLAGILRDSGLHAPEIYAADADHGFALLEDLGDDLYVRAIDKGAEEHDLYARAADVLVHLHATRLPQPVAVDYTLLDYDETALMAEANLLVEWYWPWLRGGKAPDRAIEAYRSAWRQMLSSLSAPHTLVLRDYHAENILWLEKEGDSPLQRVGLIDFQDGLYGHGAYDLVSLAEDARRDVSAATVEMMLARYMDGRDQAGGFDRAAFARDYAILAAQRNAKILGVFARLVVRDAKKRYEGFMPRVRGHFARDLARPEAAPLKDWIAEYMPELLSS
ncbi:aminoglycoside phosphotransferase family protein [Aquisalinus flavus]|uniref:Aminoglycoside phosphotransferase n=1 Tax=Aquisalinus flavus TaxID=1526572 RepID=A0A8J2V5U1_9PROT|nr:phosphotransferase [Aquisalinus flavus]MBD0425433.1 phosphotransferase [Aquisalinus flavus]UNE48928.1 phosphotransferase [Aquisalinus flavus]GGD16112.1 aminoglycoside phosphotransferase [Aquisalinus flavus]